MPRLGCLTDNIDLILYTHDATWEVTMRSIVLLVDDEMSAPSKERTEHQGATRPAYTKDT